VCAVGQGSSCEDKQHPWNIPKKKPNLEEEEEEKLVSVSSTGIASLPLP
jgi:hypothetical protein